MIVRSQRLIAVAIAVALATPLSAFNERRPIERTALVDAMNRERASRGLKPLHLDQRLNRAAEDRADDMLEKHYFNHVSPEGMSPFKWVDVEGYQYTEVGENLAVGYKTADAVVDGWMHSPGHRANILGKNYGDVGIAVAPSPLNGYGSPLVVALYGTQ
jgi:uncharacterized protein YkwD